MAQIKLNTIQIVHTPNNEKLLIQIVNMGHICENNMIQIKDMFHGNGSHVASIQHQRVLKYQITRQKQIVSCNW